jgi:class IIb bacteriocin, lactobin A/cerein 7B family
VERIMTLVIIILKIEKENWMVLNLENVNCVTLQDEELMMVNGGLAPIVIGGVVVGWKVIGGVAGVIAASGAAGIAAGYYANRP